MASYPLLLPGRPDRLRTSHFPVVDVPCLFVSGSHDAFGSPSELLEAAEVIPGPVSHVWLEGGDRGLGKHASDAGRAVARWLIETFAVPLTS
jgi:predicted alpha/beta-hydrolase family hydrolase